MLGSLGEEEATLSPHSICKKMLRNFMADLPIELHDATLPIYVESYIVSTCENGLLLGVLSGLGLMVGSRG